MADALASSIVQSLLGVELGPTEQNAGNRLVLDGVTLRPKDDGALEIGIRRLDVASLRLASGPLTLELGRVTLNGLEAVVRIEQATPRLRSLQAASAELLEVKVHGPVNFPPPRAPGAAPKPGESAPREAAAGAWRLDPLAGADARIRAEIVDAHLLFDADVTVPIRQGRIDFNEATVEHVGPDSRMGVSRLGVYVDAPNGRSYLYQFPSAPAGGVEYEQRGSLLGARVTDRGKLRLQPFVEALMRQGPGGAGQGVTEQARHLLGRTSMSGDVQLGDGAFSAPGVRAELLGRAQGRNTIRLHSQAVGRGLTAEMRSLSVRNAVLAARGKELACDEITGTTVLQVSVEDGQLHFAFNLASMRISGLRLHPA